MGRERHARRCGKADHDSECRDSRPADTPGHPIRLIKPMVDRALSELSPTFSQMYAKVGRPSIPPEHLLKGMPVDGPLHHKERAPVLRAAAI